MAFAGSTYEPEGRGRLAFDGFMTLSTAEEGRCHIDPKLQPVYTPGPAARYDLSQKSHVMGMGFGSSTSSRFDFNDTRVRRKRAPPQPRPSTMGSGRAARSKPLASSASAESGGSLAFGERPSTSDATVLTAKQSFGSGQTRPSTSGGEVRKYWTFGDGKKGRPKSSDHSILFGFRGRPRTSGSSSVASSGHSTAGTAFTSQAPPPTPQPSLFSSSQRYAPVQWRTVTSAGGADIEGIALRGRGADSPGPKYFPPCPTLHHLATVDFTKDLRFQGPEYYIPVSHSPGPPEYIPADHLTRDHRNERKLTDAGRNANGSMFGFVKHHLSPGPIYAPWDSSPRRKAGLSTRSHHACAQRPRIIGKPVKRDKYTDWIH